MNVEESPPSGASLHRRPFAAGEAAVIFDPARNRHYFVQLRPGRTFQTHKSGYIRHNDLIGQPDGARLPTSRGNVFICFRPTLEDHLLNLPRRTQILYPKDLGLILLKSNIYPGARVLEAGIGSGSLATVLMRFLGPSGHLFSYEVREEFASLAAENLALARQRYSDGGADHTLRMRDVYEGIPDDDLDTVLLDVPEPARAVDHVAGALRPGGMLLSWLPTTLQVYTLVRGLQQDDRFFDVGTVEVLARPWDVAPNSIRPAHRMVAHTGFLIHARRCQAEISPPDHSDASTESI
ncbi:MAG: tRNA (adenine-N1)-methyltransferase [Thermaerobacterales bacterium]